MIFIPHARSLAEPLRRVAVPLLLLSIYQLILIEFVNPHMAIVWWQLPLLPLLALLARRRRIAPPVAIAYGLIQLYLLSEPAVGWGVVIWFYLPGLLWLVHACPRPRALLGYGLWTGWMIAMGIYAWLWRAMASFWEIPLLHALPIFALVVLLIGFQMALIFPLVRLAGGRLPFIPIAVSAVIIHAAVEFWMPLPFPIDVALAFSNLPLLLQPADRVGLHGVGLIVLAAGAALAAAVIHARRRRWRRSVLAFAALALILSLHLGYGLWAWRRYAPRPSPLSINVALIQPVAPLKIHNADHAAKDRIARKLVRMSHQAVAAPDGPPDLLIWPEGAAAFATRTRDFNPEYLDHLIPFIEQTTTTLVVQDVEFVHLAGDPRPRYYSTISVIGPGGQSHDAYRKSILMPFTEYIPLERSFPFLRRVFPETRSALPGTGQHMIRAPGGRMIPLLCYEVLFPDYVREFVRREEGTFIVNLTNDRWYGPRQQPAQHLAFARIRAIEHRKPLIRATNSGISALIDARGAIAPGRRTAIMEETILHGTIHPRLGATFYARRGDLIPRWLLTPLFLLILLALLLPRKSA